MHTTKHRSCNHSSHPAIPPCHSPLPQPHQPVTHNDNPASTAGCNTLGIDCCGACIVTQIISNRITENIVTSETKTEDNVFVRVSCAVQQQPKASRVKDCVYRLRNPRAQIESYVGDVVRGQVPNMTLEEVFTNKDAIADAVGEKITHSMADFGWSILQSLVVNVDPDQSVKTAMNKLEAANKQREASEITAEAQKVVRVRLAEANAESKFLQGQGISLQRAAIINGLRDSVGTEERELSPQMVSELLLITQYYDTLEKMADARGKTIFMPNGIETISETTQADPRGHHGRRRRTHGGTHVRQAHHAVRQAIVQCHGGTLGQES